MFLIFRFESGEPTQGTYGSPETPPLKSGEPRFP